MSAAQHTPGPWDLYGMTADGCKIAAMDVPFTHVATVMPLLPKYLGESVANARLIAAAPELLAALRDIGARTTTDEPLDFGPALADIQGLVRIALAKVQS